MMLGPVVGADGPSPAPLVPTHVLQRRDRPREPTWRPEHLLGLMLGQDGSVGLASVHSARPSPRELLWQVMAALPSEGEWQEISGPAPASRPCIPNIVVFPLAAATMPGARGQSTQPPPPGALAVSVDTCRPEVPAQGNGFWRVCARREEA